MREQRSGTAMCLLQIKLFGRGHFPGESASRLASCVLAGLQPGIAWPADHDSRLLSRDRNDSRAKVPSSLTTTVNGTCFTFHKMLLRALASSIWMYGAVGQVSSFSPVIASIVFCLLLFVLARWFSHGAASVVCYAEARSTITSLLVP